MPVVYIQFPCIFSSCRADFSCGLLSILFIWDESILDIPIAPSSPIQLCATFKKRKLTFSLRLSANNFIPFEPKQFLARFSRLSGVFNDQFNIKAQQRHKHASSPSLLLDRLSEMTLQLLADNILTMFDCEITAFGSLLSLFLCSSYTSCKSTLVRDNVLSA